jgi:hypothetical protein
MELIKVCDIIQDYMEINVTSETDGELITGNGAHQSEWDHTGLQGDPGQEEG